MRLSERLTRDPASNSAAAARAQTDLASGGQQDFMELKSRLHRMLIERMDLTKLNLLTPQQTQAEVARLGKELLADEDIPLSNVERERLIEEVRHELFGFGPLEPLLSDPTVSDILVNSPYKIYIERGGKLERVGVTFNDNDHVMRVIERIVSLVGRRIDESSPMVDARLPDGSRVNAVIPPVSLDGPALSIRRFGAEPLRMNKLIEYGALTADVAEMLKLCVRARMNVLISGGTGAGKTTMLNALSAYIPEDERIITIEDSAELLLQQPHVLRMETRPRNIEGRGEITQRDLVKNALRMRPDRIIVGEVRGEEAIDMLQAMNTGHDGSMSTVHANETRDALDRMELMIALSGIELPTLVARQYIASAVQILVHMARLSTGERKVVRISELCGCQDGLYQIEDIFVYRMAGVDSDGKSRGAFYATGYEPQALKRLASRGFDVPAMMFAARELATKTEYRPRVM